MGIVESVVDDEVGSEFFGGVGMDEVVDGNYGIGISVPLIYGPQKEFSS